MTKIETTINRTVTRKKKISQQRNGYFKMEVISVRL